MQGKKWTFSNLKVNDKVEKRKEKNDMSESQNDQFYEIVPPKYCPIVGGYCQEHCAWDIGGECAVVSIAGSLNALPLDEVTEAVNHVAAELKRKVY